MIYGVNYDINAMKYEYKEIIYFTLSFELHNCLWLFAEVEKRHSQ